jgi:hypothetical protein
MRLLSTNSTDPSVIEWANLRSAYLRDKEPGAGTSKALSQQLAPTVAGVIAKLRAVLYNNTMDPRVIGAVLCEEPLSYFDAVRREALLGDDYENECIWMAIDSLEGLYRPEANGDLIAALDKAEAAIRLPAADGASAEEDDEIVERRNNDLYAIIDRIQALPNTPANLAIRARAVCSAVDYTGIAAEMTLSELGAHAESNAGELVREILACLLGQTLEPAARPSRVGR